MGCDCAGKELIRLFLVELVLVASTFVYDHGLEFSVLRIGKTNWEFMLFGRNVKA